MSLDQTIRKWKSEVEREMQRLIERGVPPWDAAEQAREIVSRRRVMGKVKRD